MLLQTVISQNNYDTLTSQPPTSWGALDDGNYPALPSVLKVDLFIPTISGVDTFNHIPIVKELGGVIHVAYSTAEENEENPGSYVRYQKSEDYGRTWSIPITLLESQDDPTKNRAVDGGRVTIPSTFTIYGSELYAIIEINDRDSDADSTPRTRTGVGVLAVKVNYNSTFDTPVWIENLYSTFTAPAPIPTYPAYLFDSSLRYNLRYSMIKFADTPLIYYSAPLNDPLSSESLFGSIRILEPSTAILSNGQYLKLWRPVDTGMVYKIAQTSDNNITWSEPYITQIPDSPSRTVILTLKSKEVVITGNNNNVIRSPLFSALSSDGFNYKSENIYDIDVETTGASFSGIGKGTGVQYPDAIEMGSGEIIIIYSVNKEGIRCAIFDKPVLN